MSGEEATADRGWEGIMKKGRELLGADKMLWSRKSKARPKGRKKGEVRLGKAVSLGSELMKTVNLEENRKLNYRDGVYSRQRVKQKV